MGGGAEETILRLGREEELVGPTSSDRQCPGKKQNPRRLLLLERKGRSRISISPLPFSPADMHSLSFRRALLKVRVTVPTACYLSKTRVNLTFALWGILFQQKYPSFVWRRYAPSFFTEHLLLLDTPAHRLSDGIHPAWLPQRYMPRPQRGFCGLETSAPQSLLEP